jgi:transposase
MKERVDLSKEEQRIIAEERFCDGKPAKELAFKYNVCARTIIRISNKYRKEGAEAFAEKEKVKRPESAEEKIKRLEEENEILRLFQKELRPYLKKK